MLKEHNKPLLQFSSEDYYFYALTSWGCKLPLAGCFSIQHTFMQRNPVYPNLYYSPIWEAYWSFPVKKFKVTAEESGTFGWLKAKELRENNILLQINQWSLPIVKGSRHSSLAQINHKIDKVAPPSGSSLWELLMLSQPSKTVSSVTLMQKGNGEKMVPGSSIP